MAVLQIIIRRFRNKCLAYLVCMCISIETYFYTSFSLLSCILIPLFFQHFFVPSDDPWREEAKKETEWWYADGEGNKGRKKMLEVQYSFGGRGRRRKRKRRRLELHAYVQSRLAVIYLIIEKRLEPKSKKQRHLT